MKLTFLRNSSWLSTYYMVLYPRRQKLFITTAMSTANPRMILIVLVDSVRHLIHNNYDQIKSYYFICTRGAVITQSVQATDWTTECRGSILSRGESFSLLRNVQTASGAHSASYPMATEDCFLSDKAAGAWSWPLTSIWSRGKNGGAIPPLPHTFSWRDA
jgi:hypothetical protein